jgi:DNA (cytosine-5)-methyltransferase 1
MAGKRKGKEDDRHLWPEMLRAIREIQPTYVVGENVFGLINWSGGLVFEEVQTDLEAEGYEVQAFILPACAKDAPHRRDRIWFVAHTLNGGHSTGRKEESGQDSIQSEKRAAMDTRKPDGADISRDVANTHSDGCERSNSQHEINTSERGVNALNDINKATMHTNGTSKQGEHIGQTRQGELNRPDSRNGINNFQNFPTQSPICNGDDGLSSRLDGITFPKWRNESIKAGGNAIVPQVAYEIFKAIKNFALTADESF